MSAAVLPRFILPMISSLYAGAPVPMPKFPSESMTKTFAAPDAFANENTFAPRPTTVTVLANTFVVVTAFVEITFRADTRFEPTTAPYKPPTAMMF